MSIFRNIVANGMQPGRQADTVEIATTPDLAHQQGVTFSVSQHGQHMVAGEAIQLPDAMVTISLADGRELAAWLIEHCVTGEPFVPTVEDEVRERLANSPRAQYVSGGGGGGAFDGGVAVGGRGGAGGSSYIVGSGGVAMGGSGGAGGTAYARGNTGSQGVGPMPKMCPERDPHESHQWGAEGQFTCAGAS